MIQMVPIEIDPLVWEIPLFILAVIFALYIIYLVRIHIAYRMAKKRHRDPLGWVLLSIFVSPVLTWIILSIAGNKD